MVARFIRLIKNNWAILMGNAELVFNDKLPEGYLPSEWISSKALDNDLMICNAGYSKKYKGYLVVVVPVSNSKTTENKK